MQNFTPEDLLQFFYNETSPTQTALIKNALEKDWKLNEAFISLTKSIHQLKPIEMAPSAQTLENIFNYAEKSVDEFSASV